MDKSVCVGLKTKDVAFRDHLIKKYSVTKYDLSKAGV